MNGEFERVKKEWLACARFIRKTYSFKFPSHFDGEIESVIDEHLRKDFVHRRSK